MSKLTMDQILKPGAELKVRLITDTEIEEIKKIRYKTKLPKSFRFPFGITRF